LEGFFDDMRSYLQSQAFDATEIGGPLREDIKMESFPVSTTFGKKLEATWKNGSLH
jgi:hypothetical protein